MKHYELEAANILRELGVKSSYLGFSYIVYGTAKVIEFPELIIYICKGLYTEIAIHFYVETYNVERNIRTAITNIWDSGNRELLERIFGRKLTARPKNTEFFEALSYYIVNNSKES